MKRVLNFVISAALLLSIPFGLSISVYSQETYEFVLKWGSEGSGDGQFGLPIGIAVNSEGYVYVSDQLNHRVQKFDSNGNFVAKWGNYGFGNGQFYYVAGLAVGPDDSVYVIDFANERIQKFDSDGNFITKWGSYGSGDGQFNEPYFLAVDADGYVYVTDTINYRVQKFDSDGNFITKWGSRGAGDGQIDWAPGIAVDMDGFVYVSDPNNDRIQKFDSSGNFITKWGSRGAGDGQFRGPLGVAADKESSVFVVDWGNSRIQKFDSSGNFITKWGSSGTGDGQFNRLWDVAVEDNGNVFVIDTSNNRVQKFALYNTPPGDDVVTQPVDPETGEAPVTLTFDEVTEGGDTTLTINETGPPPESGFRLGSPPRYYEIETTAVYAGPITLCFDYTGTSFAKESNLKLFHQESGGSWIDITTSLDTENNIICGTVYSLSTFVIFETMLEVDIDIKPGSYPNSINLGSNGNVPVAIFSTASFDATTVDPSSVTLAGAEVRIKGKGDPQAKLEDANGDGLLDMIVHIDTNALVLSLGDTEAILEGETEDGILFWGSDMIRIVK